MSAQSMQTRLQAGARLRFKDLKYKLLGLPVPRAISHPYVPPTTWTETDTLQYLRQTRVLAQSAIALLARATDLRVSLPMCPPIRAQLRQPNSLEKLLRADADFKQSLANITAYDYGAKYTERISNFLIHKLRPGHSLELTPDMYNQAIGYFLAINDIHMAQLLFQQMQARRIDPDTATVNLFLASQARRIAGNPYPLEQLGHPLLMTISLLKKMDHLKIKANSETWNMVLQCMPFGFGKSFLVEEMDRRGIALNSMSQQICLKTIISENGSDHKDSSISPRLYEAVLNSLDLENPIVMRLIIDRALSQKQPGNNNVMSALNLLRGAALTDRSSETLNVFLCRFAQRKHLDWQFGILSDFQNTTWDPLTWEYFIQCASMMFYTTPQRYIIIGTILKQVERENIPLTPRARVYARRAIREAAMRGRKFFDLGPSGWETLKENLRWTPGTMTPHNAAYLTCIGFGSKAGPTMELNPAVLDFSRFEALPKTSSLSRRKSLDAALKQPITQLKEDQGILSTL